MKRARLVAPERKADPVSDLYAAYNPELGDLVAGYYFHVVALQTVDRETREMVRLRCARVNGCEVCQTTRWVVKDGQPLSSEASSAIDQYENAALPERQKVALRITDAYLTNPAAAKADSFRAVVHEQFSVDEIRAILLDVTQWAAAKVGIALDADESADRLMDFDETGSAYLVSTTAAE